MNDKYQHFPIDNEPSDAESPDKKAGPILITITILVVLLNLWASYREAAVKFDVVDSYSAGQLFGYIFGGAFMLQFIVIALFGIGARFRTGKAMMKIYCWTSIFVLFVHMGSLGAAAKVAGN